MGWKAPRKKPLFLRTLNNWKKYRKYTKQYQGTRDDLVHKLLRLTIDFGFNMGVEKFEADIEYENWKKQSDKETELRRLSRMNSVSIEQMIAQQNRMKEIEEKQKTYAWDPNWKPTASEIENGNYVMFYNETIAPTMHYRIYHVPEKLAYVGISTIPDCKPEVVVCDSLAKVTNRLDPLFNHFKSTIGEKVKEEYENSLKVKTIKVTKSPNISHVEKAMGINNEENPDQSKKINDLLDDIF